jgi:ABC-type lipoprotein release transport system permease subunit
MENVLLKIAVRNLLEHKTKSLIIGMLIMIGITILVVGNSFIDTAAKGIEENYISNYTGNIIITSSEMEVPSLTMPMMSGDLEAATPIIPQYNEIREYIVTLPQVHSVAQQIDGLAIIKWEDKGEGFSILFGVEPESYMGSFPDGITILEGQFLQAGEPGIILSKEVAQSLSDSANEEIKPGDKVLITAMNGTSGTKIRELTIYGIHELTGSSPELEMVSYVDPENMRILNGITLNTIDKVDLSSDEEALMGSVDEDDLFGSDDDSLFSDASTDEEEFAIDDWDSILGDTSIRDFYNVTNPDGWHFMMVRLNNIKDTDKTIAQLNSYFDEREIEAKAWDWIDGAGMSAQLANTMKIAFNILILIVAIVAVIIIMNTLVISVTERIGEIGTMRAIGARKGFVRMMITWETIIISAFFGLLGIVLGAIIVGIMGAIGFTATNMFMQVLLGGTVFRPVLSLTAMGSSLLVITLVGIIASLYPVSVALKISPVTAMNE